MAAAIHKPTGGGEIIAASAVVIAVFFEAMKAARIFAATAGSFAWSG